MKKSKQQNLEKTNVKSYTHKHSFNSIIPMFVLVTVSAWAPSIECRVHHGYVAV